MKDKKSSYKKSARSSRFSESSEDLKVRRSDKNEWRKYGKNLLKVYNYE